MLFFLNHIPFLYILVREICFSKNRFNVPVQILNHPTRRINNKKNANVRFWLNHKMYNWFKKNFALILNVPFNYLEMKYRKNSLSAWFSPYITDKIQTKYKYDDLTAI